MHANNSTAERLAELFSEILREFILHPGELEVVAVQLTKSATVHIKANGGDVGRIIGERGAHFKALQHVCLAVSHKHKTAIELAPVAEPESGRADRYQKFAAKENWREKEVLSLLTRTVRMIFRHESVIDIETKNMPGAITVFTVRIARAEDGDIVQIMQAALKTIFNAVGKANGRTLYVELIAEKSHEAERQPKSAGGRYCKEVRR